jgi:hypothetical protein
MAYLRIKDQCTLSGLGINLEIDGHGNIRLFFTEDNCEGCEEISVHFTMSPIEARFLGQKLAKINDEYIGELS